MRHNLTEAEVRRMFEAKDLAEANRIAQEIEEQREAEEKEGRCYWHNREMCGRCSVEDGGTIESPKETPTP